MIRHYVFSLILMLGTVGIASPSQLGDQYVRPPEDVQRLQAILASVGIKPVDSLAARATLTQPEVRDLFWDAFVLIHDKQDYENGLRVLKQVLAYDPDFAATWPEEKVQANAFDELAGLLYRSGDWENALPALELREKEIHIRRPNADTFGIRFIAECRRKLAEQGKAPRESLIVIGQTAIGPPPLVRNGGIMVRARELADWLHLRIVPNGNDGLRITDGEGEYELKVWIGKQTAMAGKSPVVLRVPPERSGNDILLPLRAVAEHFGNSVTWEAGPQVAWISEPAACSSASDGAVEPSPQVPGSASESVGTPAPQSIFYQEPDKQLQEQIRSGLEVLRGRTSLSDEVAAEVRDRTGQIKPWAHANWDHMKWMRAHKDAAVLVLAELAVSEDVVTRRHALYILSGLVNADEDVIIDKEGRRTTPVGDLALKLYFRSVRDRDNDVRFRALRGICNIIRRMVDSIPADVARVLQDVEEHDPDASIQVRTRMLRENIGLAPKTYRDDGMNMQ